ncbi:MAG TPA: TolC family protein [Bryobacteraceae bacterium]|jgi:outer membrane protein TolC/AcrR family transcriptional regulator
MTDRSVSDQKRNCILGAARRVFSKKGYAETAVDDVADEAGVAKGTVYLYFKSKEDLYMAVLAGDLRQMSAEARREMSLADGFRDKIRAFLRVRLEFSKTHEEFYRIYLAEYGSMFVKAPISGELMQLFRANMRHVAQVVEEASKRGEIRPVPAGPVAASLFDISRGLLERRLLNWREFRVQDEVEFSVNLLYAGLARPRQRASVRRRRVALQRATLLLALVLLPGLVRAQYASSGGGARAQQLPLSGRTGQALGAFQGSAPSAAAPGAPLQLTLAETIRRGLQYNLASTGFEQSIRQARGLRASELANLMPHVTTGAMVNEQQINLAVYGFKFSLPGFSIPSVVGPFHYFDVRGRVTETASFTDLRNYRASEQTEKATELSAQDARDVVVLAVTSGYLGVISSAASVESIRAQVAAAQVTYRQAVDRHDNGLSARIDVTRSQVELQTQQQRLTAQQADFDKRKIQFGRVIGLPPGQEFTLTDAVPYAPLEGLSQEQALARAAATRADLKAAQAQVEAAELARKAAVAERYPSAEFSGDYGVIGTSPQNSHGTFTISGTLRIPVWEGGRVRADIEQADAALQQRRLEYQDLRAQVDAEIRQAFLDLNAAASQVSVAESSRNLAQETLSQARDRFGAGVADTIEVVQAQEAVAVAEQEYIGSLLAHNLAKANLARSMGQADQGVQQLLGRP